RCPVDLVRGRALVVRSTRGRCWDRTATVGPSLSTHRRHLPRTTVPDPAAVRERHADGPFVRACRGLPHDTVPVWFMRQAGRALAEYRAIRARHSFEEVVHTPELAAEVTLQPVRR